MTDAAFEALAAAALEQLMEHIENTAGDIVEVDLDDGVLTIELDTGAQFLLNRHVPTAELWLSSPVSGAAHFTHHAATGAWRDRRGGDDLIPRLQRELSQALGRPVTLG